MRLDGNTALFVEAAEKQEARQVGATHPEPDFGIWGLGLGGPPGFRRLLKPKSPEP